MKFSDCYQVCITA